VRSFRNISNPRREMYLALAGSIESQLRDAFARQSKGRNMSQSSLAKKLGINRSAVHKRLTGQTNMTIETIADMLWALDQDFNISVFDRSVQNKKNNNRFQSTEVRQNSINSNFSLNESINKIAETTPTSQPMIKMEIKPEIIKPEIVS
jgi:transcriptional regulator with XRE-family HTH domain